ncbi:DUF2780 domain-containing protein [Methylohalobius crimeensis]|uniref:DUF2780 domain-containing protein n=1 Tax=Methylohalobius crimeensis TaxID=244365 RepID=UPI0003B4C70A|nr:DUF2780 domain-containing protein [Methylohalobius crimeensis]
MNHLNFKPVTAYLLVIACAGCAGNGGGEDVVGSVDRSLATAESAAQTGRQAISTGTAAAKSVPATQTELSNLLVSRLGVSQQQALGGAGAIFQAAKANMEPQAFASLSQSVPGMDQMLSAVPSTGVSSMLGGAQSKLGTAASLASQFQQLNMSPDMANQFIPVVVDYVRDTSGQAASRLLQSALTTAP